jgi:uncharacterized protein YjbI with pentapeptide repeats
MRDLTQEEKAVLEKHQLWLKDDSGGERADLREADLSGADLREADLREADLRGADLRDADLRGVKGRVLAVGPIGSRNDITYIVWTPERIEIRCGCFFDSLEKWEQLCRTVHADSPHGAVYAAAAIFIRAHAAAYWEGEKDAEEGKP